jgi:DMSO/TMAO reductase YedYZ heme-binding membrane subunit
VVEVPFNVFCATHITPPPLFVAFFHVLSPPSFLRRYYRIWLRSGIWYDQIPGYSLNHAFGPSSLTGFALTQVPGIVAHLYRNFRPRRQQQQHRNSIEDAVSQRTINDAPKGATSSITLFPRIVYWGLAIRKHLGLLSFFSLACHVVSASILVSPLNSRYQDAGYYDRDGIPSDTNTTNADLTTSNITTTPTANHPHQYQYDVYLTTKNFELSLFFGMIGFGMYCIMSLSSIPSIGAGMSYAQWDLVFGKVVWCALILSVIHCILLIPPSKDTVDTTTTTAAATSDTLLLPPPSVLASVIPFMTILFKIVQVLLCRWKRYKQQRQQRHYQQDRQAATTRKSLYRCNIITTTNNKTVIGTSGWKDDDTTIVATTTTIPDRSP